MPHRELHLVYLFPNLDTGGGVKGLQQVVARQLQWARVTAAAKSDVEGPRTPEYQAMGVATPRNLQHAGTRKHWIEEEKPDVVVVHRAGNTNAVDNAILADLRQAGVRCFEINIFACHDPSTRSVWEGQFHVSRWSTLKYTERAGLPSPPLAGHQPLGYGIDPWEPFSIEERQAARQSLGIPADAFVASRLLRPDLRKWDALPVLAMARLVKEVPRALFLVREAPAANQAWIARRLGSHVRSLPMTRSPEEFRQTVAASDCLLNYSGIGESFGVAIIEGMAAGLPVLTNSQPRLDNAQVEHCQHEVTGLVANTITGLATALQRLAVDEDLRRRLGENGRRYANECFSAQQVETRLRRFVRQRLIEAGDPRAELIPSPDDAEDPYAITPAWVAQFRTAERAPHEQGVTDSVADRLALASIRLRNQFGHATQLGWGKTARVVWRRISQGRLGR